MAFTATHLVPTVMAGGPEDQGADGQIETEPWRQGVENRLRRWGWTVSRLFAFPQDVEAGLWIGIRAGKFDWDHRGAFPAFEEEIEGLEESGFEAASSLRQLHIRAQDSVEIHILVDQIIGAADLGMCARDP